MVGIFYAFCHLLIFQNQLTGICSGEPSECQTVKKGYHSVGPDLSPNCLERFSADHTEVLQKPSVFAHVIVRKYIRAQA